jgi:hypothetical protein
LVEETLHCKVRLDEMLRPGNSGYRIQKPIEAGRWFYRIALQNATNPHRKLKIVVVHVILGAAVHHYGTVESMHIRWNYT